MSTGKFYFRNHDPKERWITQWPSDMPGLTDYILSNDNASFCRLYRLIKEAFAMYQVQYLTDHTSNL